VHKVTRSYVLATCGVDNLRPIPMEYGVYVAPHDVIKMCIFCNKIFMGFWSRGGQNFRFPIDFADYCYNSAHCAACDNRNRLLLSVGKHRYFCLFLVFL